MADLDVLEGRCGVCGQLGYRIVRQGEHWHHYGGSTSVAELATESSHRFVLGRLEPQAFAAHAEAVRPGFGWREAATGVLLAIGAMASAGIVFIAGRWLLVPLAQFLLEVLGPTPPEAPLPTIGA